MIKRLSALPGVVAVAGASAAPFTRTAAPASVIEGGVPEVAHDVQRRDITEDYFRALGIPILAGRPLVAADRDIGVPYWVVVSNALASRLSGGTAVGKRLSWGGSPLEIVGIVEDVKHQKASEDESPAIYLLNFRLEQINYLLVRTSGDVRPHLPAIRRAIIEANPAVQVTSTVAMGDLTSEAMASERFLAFISTAFGATALGLAAVGLFGLTSYLVARRQREIAVRMALGANRTDIRRLVVLDVTGIISVGLIVGLPAAVVTVHLLRSLLFGVSALPLGVFVSGFVTLAAAAAAAVSNPVRRAGQVNIVQALRSD
jgi:hypothetical protein